MTISDYFFSLVFLSIFLETNFLFQFSLPNYTIYFANFYTNSWILKFNFLLSNIIWNFWSENY